MAGNRRPPANRPDSPPPSGSGWRSGRPKQPFALYLEGIRDNRQVKVDADLCAETPAGYQVFQFAGFAEGMKKWKSQAQALAPYAAWIHWLLKQAAPDKPVSIWLVFPVEGQAVDLHFG